MRFSSAPARLLLTLALCAVPAFCQQEKGDTEVGISGSLDVNHKAPITGTLFSAVSYGKFTSRSNYFGITMNPMVTFGSDNSVGGFAGANYRRLFGAAGSKVFPFAGGGGGVYLSARKGGGSSAAGSGFGEVGVKSFLSQKTSFEVSYQFLYLQGSGAASSFAANTRSLVVLSIRHLF